MTRPLSLLLLLALTIPVVAADPAPDSPRRLLGICACDYLYANPVSYGTDPRGTARRDFGTVLARLAEKLAVPKKQAVELSDGASPANRRPPLKAAIEQTLTRFLDSSRRQDRIVLMFVGHAVEVDGKPYLVPLDGDFSDVATLIPLAWVMEKLEKCPAQQKVFVADLCRYDQAAGLFRPGGPLPPAVAAALKNPPAGVQVWSACSGGEYSYEFETPVKVEGFEVRGGAFLNWLAKALAAGVGGVSHPEDPLPLEPLTELVGVNLKTMLPGRQTPFLAGKPGLGVLVDPKEAPAKPVDLPPLPPTRVEVAALLAEVRVPPIRALWREPPTGSAIALLPYAIAALKPYAADPTGPDNPARAATRKAIETMRSLVKETPWELTNGDPKKLKATILQLQRGPAHATLELQDALDALDAAEGARAKDESPRWRAHYDLTRARLILRLAHYHELNLMYGLVRKDALPDLDKAKGETGWRLAAAQKMQSPNEVRDQVKDAVKILKKIEKDHAGTPWAVLAHRERLTRHGLEWVPARLK